MAIDDALKELIVKSRPTDEVKQAARKAGMKTLQQDGFDKAIKGLTAIEEVLRVTYTDE